MKLRCVCMLLAGLLALACAKTSAIKSGAAPLPDLSAYHTYHWLQNEPQAHLDMVTDVELDHIIRNVIAYHLERRGLQPATENPDLLITYRTNLREVFSDMPLSRGKPKLKRPPLGPRRAQKRKEPSALT